MDLRTFATSFGQCDWSVMMILAEDDSTFARLQFRAVPRLHRSEDPASTFDQPFDGSDHDAWQQEYQQLVEKLPERPLRTTTSDDEFPPYRPLDFEAIDQGEVEPEPWYCQEETWAEPLSLIDQRNDRQRTLIPMEKLAATPCHDHWRRGDRTDNSPCNWPPMVAGDSS